MITSSSFNKFTLFWPPICEHIYERRTRTKWHIYLNYRCGAKTEISEIADDFIQYLILGAFNSDLIIHSNIKEIDPNLTKNESPIIVWKDFENIALEKS